MMRIHDVTVIGAGPAGLACAIQLKRSGLSPVVIEKDRIGGLLLNANLVENYPGFPRGISGPELVRRFESQLRNTRVVARFEEVIELDHRSVFRVRTERDEFESRFVVVACGTQPRQVSGLEIPDEVSNRIFYEVRDLPDARDKRMVIVGGGDAAFDYALNLVRKNHVTILNRSDRPRCLRLLWERVRQSSGIEYIDDAMIFSVQPSPDGVRLAVRSSAGDWELAADYVIFAIGRIRNLGFLTERLRDRLSELEKDGLIHLVGDAKNGVYRQVSIAVGDGVRAAMHIHQIVRGAE